MSAGLLKLDKPFIVGDAGEMIAVSDDEEVSTIIIGWRTGINYLIIIRYIVS